MQSHTNKIINVFGEEEPNPICQFRNCYHPLSWHNGRNSACDCHHFMNMTLGVKSNKELSE